MSKKRGVSADEKRQRMAALFHEKKDVFQLKELEKLGPAEKGVIAQSVKDVVQSLVDDGLVESEKIGTSIYFWSFPSNTVLRRKRKLSELESKNEELENQRDTITQQIKRARLERTDSDEREELNKKVVELERLKEKLTKLVAQYSDSDPDVIKREKEEIEMAKAAANRWTDNIFSACSWLKQKFNMEQEDLNKQFDIPDNLDYLD